MEKDFLQLYAGEMDRLLWSKAAMDRIRNLALLILVGMILISFGFPEPTSHRVSYFGSLAVFALVLFEARLFRFHAVSEQRIRLFEQSLVSATAGEQNVPEHVWEQQLAAGYANQPRPSLLQAMAYRIYENYFIIFLVLDTAWLSKVYLSPQPASGLSEFVHRLDLGFFSGWATVAFMTVFWALFIFIVIKIRAKKKQAV